jgi:hypothetical protein
MKHLKVVFIAAICVSSLIGAPTRSQEKNLQLPGQPASKQVSPPPIVPVPPLPSERDVNINPSKNVVIYCNTNLYGNGPAQCPKVGFWRMESVDIENHWRICSFEGGEIKKMAGHCDTGVDGIDKNKPNTRIWARCDGQNDGSAGGFVSFRLGHVKLVPEPLLDRAACLKSTPAPPAGGSSPDQVGPVGCDGGHPICETFHNGTSDHIKVPCPDGIDGGMCH